MGQGTPAQRAPGYRDPWNDLPPDTQDAINQGRQLAGGPIYVPEQNTLLPNGRGIGHAWTQEEIDRAMAADAAKRATPYWQRPGNQAGAPGMGTPPWYGTDVEHRIWQGTPNPQPPKPPQTPAEIAYHQARRAAKDADKLASRRNRNNWPPPVPPPTTSAF